MKNRKSNKRILIKILIFSLVVLSLLLLIMALIRIKTQETEKETSGMTEVESSESSEVISSVPESEEETDIVAYPAPQYDFTCEEVTIKIPGMSEEYTFAWVSDLHMITDLAPAEDVMPGNEETIQFRYEFFSTPDGMRSVELWPEVVNFLNYGDFDGVILGGDMLDYCSNSNLKMFMQEFEKLNPEVPVLYIRADHDYGYWYGGEVLKETDTHALHKTIDKDDINDKYWEFDDFIIIGVNNSTKDMPQEQLDLILSLYEKNKKIIMVTHVPYASMVDESLEALSMEVRQKVYYWGGGDYVPNAVTKAYLDKVYAEDTNVCQVLAGHLHAQWDGMLTQQVPQHIFTPGYMGTIGIIHVVGEETGNE